MLMYLNRSTTNQLSWFSYILKKRRKIVSITVLFL